MREELFGPVVTLHVYDDARGRRRSRLVDRTSPVRPDRRRLRPRPRAPSSEATAALRHAAGNFYINDKPTGAVVGQQPFGGARASGTNDKAGSAQNLLRWVAARDDQGDLRAAGGPPLPVDGLSRAPRQRTWGRCFQTSSL